MRTNVGIFVRERELQFIIANITARNCPHLETLVSKGRWSESLSINQAQSSSKIYDHQWHIEDQ